MTSAESHSSAALRTVWYSGPWLVDVPMKALLSAQSMNFIPRTVSFTSLTGSLPEPRPPFCSLLRIGSVPVSRSTHCLDECIYVTVPCLNS